LQRVAVLAPEIELIAGAQGRGVVDDLAAAIGQARRTRARSARIGLVSTARNARQQGRAGLPRLGIGLDDARDRGGNVEVDGLRLFHELRQLRRAETAPPIKRRRRVGFAGMFVLGGNIERGIRKVLGQHTGTRARGQAHHSDRAQRP